MANTKKKAADTTEQAAPKVESAVVVGSTKEKAKDTSTGADMVTICVALRSPHIFDDIPDGKGGVKSVMLVGLDDELRGKRQGILTADGNAKFQQLPRADWEAIKALHGSERMFNPWQGRPACVFEVKSLKDAQAGAYNDDIAAIKSDLAPVDPEAEGVTEATSLS